MSEFKIGDVVMLKSGRLAYEKVMMTIEATTQSGRFVCVWHDQDMRVQRDQFLPVVLLKMVMRPALPDEEGVAL